MATSSPVIDSVEAVRELASAAHEHIEHARSAVKEALHELTCLLTAVDDVPLRRFDWELTVYLENLIRDMGGTIAGDNPDALRDTNAQDCLAQHSREVLNLIDLIDLAATDPNA